MECLIRGGVEVETKGLSPLRARPPNTTTHRPIAPLEKGRQPGVPPQPAATTQTTTNHNKPQQTTTNNHKQQTEQAFTHIII